MKKKKRTEKLNRTCQKVDTNIYHLCGRQY